SEVHRTVDVFVRAARGETSINTGSRALSAAQRGESYDQQRVALFSRIIDEIERAPLIERHVNEPARSRLVPFYEAYFSNYIEGSTLNVEEAERVVFDNIDVGKPKDEHDIRSTWEIVSSEESMSSTPRDADDFIDMIRDRHSLMMAAHPDKLPGQFKTENNRAGGTDFVDHRHVKGTLRAGFEEGRRITSPFHRAAYMMFMISDVHPFMDGNGRSARVA